MSHMCLRGVFRFIFYFLIWVPLFREGRRMEIFWWCELIKDIEFLSFASCLAKSKTYLPTFYHTSYLHTYINTFTKILWSTSKDKWKRKEKKKKKKRREKKERKKKIGIARRIQCWQLLFIIAFDIIIIIILLLSLLLSLILVEFIIYYFFIIIDFY